MKSHILLIFLFWFCCAVNAQQASDVIIITHIAISEPSCDDDTGEIEVVAEANREGELVYKAVRTNHIGQEDTEEDDPYISLDGIFEDCLPGNYTITVSFADNDYYFVSRSIVLSQLSSAGSLTIAEEDIVDNYCNNAAGSIIVRVEETVEQPQWFAMFEALTGALLELVTVADKGIAEDGMSCIFTDVAPGKYFFKAGNTVNSCVLQSDTNHPVELTDPMLVRSVTVKDVLCKGDDPTGEIAVSVTGGVPVMSYILLNEDNSISPNTTGAISGVFTGLSANTYHLEVEDAASCKKTISNLMVHDANELTLSAQTQPIGCGEGNERGTITVTADGGAGGYLYRIGAGVYGENNIFAGLQAGSYTIAVRDANNCVSSTTVNISQTKKPDLTKSEIKDILCYLDKGVITIIATPYNPEGNDDNKITAYWIEGDCLKETDHTLYTIYSQLDGCTYTLYAQDSYGCIGDTTIVLEAPESQMALAGPNDIVKPYGNNTGSVTVTASGGWEGYTIVLTRIVGMSQEVLDVRYDLPAGDYTFDGLTAGEYRIAMTEDKKGCTQLMPQLVFILDVATGETDLEADKMKIFPNPSDGQFIIEWSDGENRKVTLEIYNINGQLVYTTNTQTGIRTTVDIGSQSSGVYLLHVPEMNIRQKLVIH